jgi:hypothetical protein
VIVCQEHKKRKEENNHPEKKENMQQPTSYLQSKRAAVIVRFFPEQQTQVVQSSSLFDQPFQDAKEILEKYGRIPIVVTINGCYPEVDVLDEAPSEMKSPHIAYCHVEWKGYIPVGLTNLEREDYIRRHWDELIPHSLLRTYTYSVVIDRIKECNEVIMDVHRVEIRASAPPCAPIAPPPRSWWCWFST